MGAGWHAQFPSSITQLSASLPNVQVADLFRRCQYVVGFVCGITSTRDVSAPGCVVILWMLAGNGGGAVRGRHKQGGQHSPRHAFWKGVEKGYDGNLMSGGGRTKELVMRVVCGSKVAHHRTSKFGKFVRVQVVGDKQVKLCAPDEVALADCDWRVGENRRFSVNNGQAAHLHHQTGRLATLLQLTATATVDSRDLQLRHQAIHESRPFLSCRIPINYHWKSSLIARIGILVRLEFARMDLGTS